MPVAAAVHLVQDEIKSVRGGDRFRLRRHEVGNGKVGIGVMQAGYLLEKIAFAEHAEELAVLIDHQNGPNIVPQHGLDGFANRGRRQNRDRRLGLEDVNDVFHEAVFDPIMSRQSIQRSQGLQAVTAFLQLGDTAKPALPDVIKLAKSDPDPGVRASALEVLRRLSPADYAQVTGQTNMVSAVAR